MAKRETANSTTTGPYVGIIGLGYVGLPLAREFCRGGAKVLGFDINSKMVAVINKGKSPIKHIPHETMAEMVKTGRFHATDDMSELSEARHADHLRADAADEEPRAGHAVHRLDQSETISKYLRKGQLVVLESTTYPGTTREVMLPILEQSGLKAGKDFFLAFSPEREDPGNKNFQTSTIPKVVGGLDEESLRTAPRASTRSRSRSSCR